MQNSEVSMDLFPVACPRCGERQNHLPGNFDPKRLPFGPVICMTCRYQFERGEYLRGQDASRHDATRRLTERAGGGRA